MPTKEEVARKLADIHYEVEAGMREIIRYTGTSDAEANSTEPIKLLEVNENTVPSGILPLGFGPLPGSGIHYPSVIVEVTPEEYERIKRHELKLPAGWSHATPLPRPTEALAE